MIVKFSADCNSKCHELFINKYGRHRYNIISPEYGLASASAADLESMQADLQKELLDYVPILPIMKVASNLQFPVSAAEGSSMKSDKKQSHCEDKKSSMQILFVMHHMEPKDFETFVDHTKKAMKKFKKVVELSIHYPETLDAIKGVLTIHDCFLAPEIARILAGFKEIHWIEQRYSAYTHNRWSKGLLDSGITEDTPLIWANFTGSGQVIGISDTGIDLFHCFFYDSNYTSYSSYQFQTSLVPSGTVLNPSHRKVIQYVVPSGYGDEYDYNEGHGTHVSGIAAGVHDPSYGDYLKFCGASSDAKIAFMDIAQGTSSATDTVTPPSDINTQLLQILYQGGARVFTFSWGSTDYSYSDYALSVDTFLYDYPDSIVFLSAGNSGPTSNTVYSPANAKNAVTVGASSNDHESWMAIEGSDSNSIKDKNMLAYFSSRGPTFDQRLKPDITAPGYWITSSSGEYQNTDPHCNYLILDGTSMASPAAAGFALKVREYFMNGYYPSGKANSADAFVPSGALIKAIMIHSGQNLSIEDNYATNSGTETFSSLTSYPSTDQGYGRIQLSKVLNFGTSTTTPLSMFVIGTNDTSDTSKYRVITSTGQTKTHTFTTDSSSSQEPIRVTMVYQDYPASYGASSALINKLTMTLSDSSGNSYSVLTASGTITSNVQMINIVNPPPSRTFTITITGTSISHPQPYALVATGAITYVNATAPAQPAQQSVPYVYISSSTWSYITFLGALAFALLIIFIVFRRLTKAKGSLMLDPKNFGADFLAELADEEEKEGTGRGQAFLAKLGLRRAQKGAGANK